jgi:hypothetical protein
VRLTEARLSRIARGDALLCAIVLRAGDFDVHGLRRLAASLAGGAPVRALVLEDLPIDVLGSDDLCVVLDALKTSRVRRLVLRRVDALACERPRAALGDLSSAGWVLQLDTSHLTLQRPDTNADDLDPLAELRAAAPEALEAATPNPLDEAWNGGGDWRRLTRAHRFDILAACRRGERAGLEAVYDELCERREEKAEILGHEGAGSVDRRLAYGLPRVLPWTHAGAKNDEAITFVRPHRRYGPFYPVLYDWYEALLARSDCRLPGQEGVAAISSGGRLYSRISYDRRREALRIDHTPVRNVPAALREACALWDQAVDESAPERVLDLALTLAWHLFQGMPVQRGNASIVEDVLWTLLALRGIECRYEPAPARPCLDLSAIFAPEPGRFVDWVRRHARARTATGTLAAQARNVKDAALQAFFT